MLSGYLSGLAILIAIIPYIRDILKGKTKPERAAWLIWSVLSAISFFAQYASGGTYSTFMSGFQAATDIFVLLLAWRYGWGGLLPRDLAALGGAALGLLLWYFTRTAAVALFIIIIIDALGVYLTVRKVYEQPSTETVSSWALTLLAGVLAAVAVGGWNLVLLAFPIYIALAAASILGAIYLGYRRELVR